MGNVPANVAATSLAEGGIASASLLEIQTISGTRGYFSNRPLMEIPLVAAFDPAGITWRPLAGIASPFQGMTVTPESGSPSTTPVKFIPWLTEPPEFKVTCDLVTQTATATLQNISGDTLYRTNTMGFVKQDIWGALFIFRIWDAANEYADFTQIGVVQDVEVDDTSMELSLATWLDFSKIAAPDCQINNSCQNVFGSQQCGSTSDTNCLNSYGNCSQLNRFKGLITQWNSGVYTVTAQAGIAQPAPNLSYNPMVPGR
jgi:hypothetical protein